ncbi:MAG: putative ATP-dependent helicase, partial [Actinomycetota bacterium]
YHESMECHLGNFGEYMALRRKITDIEKSAVKLASRSRKANATTFLNDLRRGDVIGFDDGHRHSVPYLVIDEARDYEDPRPRIISANGQVKRISISDLTDEANVLGAVQIPSQFDSRNVKSRKWVSENLAKFSISLKDSSSKKERHTSDDVELNRLRKALKAHPCHGCSDREAHARWHEREFVSKKDIHKLEDQISAKTSSIAREFDRICDVLLHLGYLKKEDAELTVTTDGQTLGRIYSELDLLAAEAIRTGLLSKLDPEAIASAVSVLVFESRKDDVEPPVLPEGELGVAIDSMFDLWGEIKDVESSYRLNYLREADAGFIWPIWKWARGQNLNKILRNSDLEPGDFVRWAKQVIDILGQLASATSDPKTARACSQARDLVDRGVVSW